MNVLVFTPYLYDTVPGQRFRIEQWMPHLRALGIDWRLNGEDVVTSGRLFVEEGKKVRGIGVGPRVGIAKGKEYLWRFFVKESRFVSGGRQAAGRRIHIYGKKGRRIRGVVG